MSIFIAMLAMVASVCLVLGIYFFSQKAQAQSELVALSRVQPKVKQSYFEIRIRPVSQRVARIFPALKIFITPTDIEEKIVFAGSPFNLSGDLFYGIQLFAGSAIATYGLLMGLLLGGRMGAFIGMLVLGVLGVFFPIFWLNREIEKRQFEITLAVPDSLDLLAASMEAGLGFDQALQHVVSRIKGPLAEEYGRFLKELQMGIPRQECFRHLYARNSSRELRALVGAVLQAHELGAPISKTLQDQAEEMREQRIQRAKEAGAQASPKISLVTTALIAPAVMCMFVAILAFFLAGKIGPLLAEFGR